MGSFSRGTTASRLLLNVFFCFPASSELPLEAIFLFCGAQDTPRGPPLNLGVTSGYVCWKNLGKFGWVARVKATRSPPMTEVASAVHTRRSRKVLLCQRISIAVKLIAIPLNTVIHYHSTSPDILAPWWPITLSSARKSVRMW